MEGSFPVWDNGYEKEHIQNLSEYILYLPGIGETAV